MKQLLITIAALVLVGCGVVKSRIHISAIEGNIEAVIQHLADGDDVNSRDVDGRTPLHIATFNNYEKLSELLITKGADVNAATIDGLTPLHNTSAKGYVKLAELLINKGGFCVTNKDEFFNKLKHLISDYNYFKITSLSASDVVYQNLGSSIKMARIILGD